MSVSTQNISSDDKDVDGKPTTECRNSFRLYMRMDDDLVIVDDELISFMSAKLQKKNKNVRFKRFFVHLGLSGFRQIVVSLHHINLSY